ncbi:MAG TPA: cupredoxin domain-containing protein [Solirubrobacteraceae bacterium]|jgi:uncharacterized cupredoxin-like copper-binding protein|nr:cupredoxin domain-containing protein [Solirubrobacteraceae bacterium]
MRTTPTTPHTARGLLAALAAALLLAAGCGSDDEGEGERTAVSGSLSDDFAATLKVTEVDFAIKPKDATVEKAGRIRFEVANRGKAPHALEIEADGEEFETETLDPGASGTVEADLKDGTYTWYCPVGDHRDRGMEGTVTVGSGGETSSGGGGGSGY